MAVYVFVFELMSIAFSAIFLWSIARGMLVSPLAPEDARRAIVGFTIGNLAYIAAIGIAFVSPYVALAITGLVAIWFSSAYWFFTNFGIKR